MLGNEMMPLLVSGAEDRAEMTGGERSVFKRRRRGFLYSAVP